MKSDVQKRNVALVMTVVLTLTFIGTANAEVTPIPWRGQTVLPVYIGAPAQPQPLRLAASGSAESVPGTEPVQLRPQ